MQSLGESRVEARESVCSVSVEKSKTHVDEQEDRNSQAYKNGLPIPTAVAPIATAFKTSLALLTPPSTKIWNIGLGKRFLCFKAVVTSSKTSIPDLA